MRIIKSTDDLKQALQHKQLAAMMGVEGGHMMEDNMAYLDSFHALGVCYMTLTWNNSTSWATSAKEETHDSLLHQPKGLNDFGRSVVHRMNELGMMIDVSHIGEQTFWDVMKITTKPVLASHSDAYKLCPVPRNLKDSQIIAIAKNGGVIDVNFYPGFVDSSFEKKDSLFNAKHKKERDSLLKINPETYYASDYLANKYKDEVEAMRPPLSMLIDHIDYLVKLAGIDHVGLGSDLDGISSTPQGIDDITDYPLITKELLQRGYSKKDIKKILGENFLRVYKANASK
jgi:membrane dipeptidase